MSQKSKERTYVLTLTAFDGRVKLSRSDWEHTIAAILDGCTSGELCLSDAKRESRGWWTYNESES